MEDMVYMANRVEMLETLYASHSSPHLRLSKQFEKKTNLELLKSNKPFLQLVIMAMTRSPSNIYRQRFEQDQIMLFIQNSCWVNWVGSVNGDFLDASITVESTGLVDICLHLLHQHHQQHHQCHHYAPPHHQIVHTGPLPLYSGLKVTNTVNKSTMKICPII